MNKRLPINQENQKTAPVESCCVNKGTHLLWKSYQDKEIEGKVRVEIGLSSGKTLSKESVTEFQEVLKRTTGAEDFESGMIILRRMAQGMIQENELERLNALAALLPGMKPQDETEAALLGQFIALQESGFQCLRRANYQEGFYHIERFSLLATKLLNTANQTMQALLKYRSKGQQTVQVVHVHNEGQAIVTQNLSALEQKRGATE